MSGRRQHAGSLLVQVAAIQVVRRTGTRQDGRAAGGLLVACRFKFRPLSGTLAHAMVAGPRDLWAQVAAIARRTGTRRQTRKKIGLRKCPNLARFDHKTRYLI